MKPFSATSLLLTIISILGWCSLAAGVLLLLVSANEPRLSFSSIISFTVPVFGAALMLIAISAIGHVAIDAARNSRKIAADIKMINDRLAENDSDK